MPAESTQIPITDWTVDALREHIARAADPIVAGVAVAAVSGGLGISLLGLTLEVTRRRKDFAGDRTRLAALLKATNRESARLVRCAGQDIAAYQEYRASLKHKRGRKAALRRIIQTPLDAASSAGRGLKLCAEAISLVPISVVSDLGAAAALLAGTMKAILLTVDVNLRQLPSASGFRRDQVKKRRMLERDAALQLERILGQAAGLIQLR